LRYDSESRMSSAVSLILSGRWRARRRKHCSYRCCLTIWNRSSRDWVVKIRVLRCASNADFRLEGGCSRGCERARSRGGILQGRWGTIGLGLWFAKLVATLPMIDMPDVNLIELN
jgi:hypothetical protein